MVANVGVVLMTCKEGATLLHELAVIRNVSLLLLLTLC
jgi:hypothetical protein